MKQQTNTEILNLIDNGGTVQLNLTGVSFENRQKIIREMMENSLSRGITLHTEIGNKYDKYAIIVRNLKGEDIGYLPKQKGFSITTPNRRRPVVFDKYTVSETGKPIQTNEIFHSDIQEYTYTGEISRFLSRGNRRDVPIGVQIKFWKV